MRSASLALLGVIAMALAGATVVAVVGCQPAQPQPVIVVTCPHCQGVNSAKCKWCNGHPHEPKLWKW